VGLVEHAVVDDQDAAVAGDQRLDLAPEGLGVRLQPVQEPGEGVVGRGVGPGRAGPTRAASTAEQTLGVARRNWM
jgi:hypothetical protein